MAEKRLGKRSGDMVGGGNFGRGGGNYGRGAANFGQRRQGCGKEKCSSTMVKMRSVCRLGLYIYILEILF